MNRMVYRGGQGSMERIPGGPVGKAKFALANGRPDEAERLARKRLEREPGDAAARLVLAQALMQQRQNAEAIQQVRRVIRAEPKNVEAHLVLSAALVQQGGIRIPAEAESAARRAVQLAPRNANAHTQLAEVLAAKRDYKAARAEIDTAVEIEPRSPSAQLMRALILVSDRDPAGAVQACDNAIRYGRNTLGGAALAQAELIKANALSEVKRYDDALAALDEVERQNPAMAGANTRSLRGRIYFKQRKWGQAYNQYVTAQRMSGKLVRFAPVLAVLNMLLSPFGNNAPVALAVVLAVIAMLIIFGLSQIPVAGGWLAGLLVLVIVGFFAFAAIRYTRGSLLPTESGARATTIGAIGAGFIIGGALALVVERAIVTGAGGSSDWFNATTVTIAGIVALILAAVAGYVWPAILGRYAGRQAAA